MAVISLTHSVHTLESELLLPAGTVLSPEMLDEFVSSCGGRSVGLHPLLGHGTVWQDVVRFLDAPPYNSIYSDARSLSGLLEDIGHVRLVEPVLQALDYFERNDYYSYRHFLLVFALSALLARDLITDPAERLSLAATGPSHDLGKICVPLGVLKKTTPLTREERRMLENHSAAGYVLLCYYLGDPNGLAPRVARDHHERRNGSGIPRGIDLDDRMVEIIAVSDVYDALISPRPYRAKSYDNRTALEEITRMAERGEIGWDVVRALVARNRKTKPHYTESEVSLEKRGTPPQGNIYGVLADKDKGPK